ncbi:MAG: hypothetical protein IT373_24345 [Polyangiaceae bacterium]|nr:hypothetical protein [Polyangiaceae bacterium]
MRRLSLLLLAVPFVAALAASGARAETPLVSSADGEVTMYAASWCSACAALARELHLRKVPFAEVDIEASPRAFERARQATGTNAIPQTSVATRSGLEWIVGADGDAVERAYHRR